MTYAVRIPLLVALCAPLVVAQNDTITWTDGTKTSNTTVTGFNLRQVTFKTRGVEESRSSDRVADLEIRKVKETYRRAYGAPRSERYGQFVRIAEAEKSDPFLAQFGYMEAARMLIENGEHGEAFTVLEDLATNCPDSGFLPEVYRAKLDYYISRASKQNVATVADKYTTAALTEGYPEGFGLEATYYKGLSAALNGELAAEQLRAEMSAIVKKADPNFPRVASRARLQIANSLRLEGKLDEAEADYRELIEDAKSAPSVRAAAWLGIGHVKSAAGNPADKEPYRDALLAFLRVYLDEDASSESLKAEALYFGSQAAEKWGGQGAARYSKILRGRLINRYPNNQWTNK